MLKSGKVGPFLFSSFSWSESLLLTYSTVTKNEFRDLELLKFTKRLSFDWPECWWEWWQQEYLWVTASACVDTLRMMKWEEEMIKNWQRYWVGLRTTPLSLSLLELKEKWLGLCFGKRWASQWWFCRELWFRDGWTGESGSNTTWWAQPEKGGGRSEELQKHWTKDIDLINH